MKIRGVWGGTQPSRLTCPRIASGTARPRFPTPCGVQGATERLRMRLLVVAPPLAAALWDRALAAARRQVHRLDVGRWQGHTLWLGERHLKG